MAREVRSHKMAWAPSMLPLRTHRRRHLAQLHHPWQLGDAVRLFGSHVTKTNALESLVIASFVRGLSVRDVEATLAEALGDQAAISKSTVSAICGQVKDGYEGWARRRLDAITLDYLFLDASFFRMHPGSPAEPVLAAWGITTKGKPAFIGLAPGSGESADAWHDFWLISRAAGWPARCW